MKYLVPELNHLWATLKLMTLDCGDGGGFAHTLRQTSQYLHHAPGFSITHLCDET